jgi:hypothetical protein
MPQLTEWLKLMIAEINRKQEDAERDKHEEAARQKEQPPARGPAPATHAVLAPATPGKNPSAPCERK